LKTAVRLAAWAGLLLAFAPAGLAAESGLSGADLAVRLGCFACHASGGIAPPLDHIGGRFSGVELARIITQPRSRNRHEKMPNYAHLRPQELQALVDYLSALK
jgi:mono/diheme cytochrome c family protein